MKKRLAGLLAVLVVSLCVPQLPVAAEGVNPTQVASWAGLEFRLLLESITYEPDPAVVEQVKAWKANEKMRAVVEEESEDPEAWWEWAESLPVESKIIMDQRELLEWLEMYSELTPEDRSTMSRNYIR